MPPIPVATCYSQIVAMPSLSSCVDEDTACVMAIEVVNPTLCPTLCQCQIFGMRPLRGCIHERDGDEKRRADLDGPLVQNPDAGGDVIEWQTEVSGGAAERPFSARGCVTRDGGLWRSLD